MNNMASKTKHIKSISQKLVKGVNKEEENYSSVKHIKYIKSPGFMDSCV